jgi:hypothetical protein
MRVTVDVDLEKVHVVEDLLRAEGFKPFDVELGGKGVGILEDFDESVIDDFKVSVGSIAKENNAWSYWS